ncbi:predicted protein [Plenodomus lingam JN3]|uniref:Predicted protein n=1 Tax=Leptosphaeria maculans (strain JN3 / isolate v23.1.3 / race Av1-4-5-6-7-8) TaxID=985895 RepID=E4ZK16_LEPMJ|nr:predicted protein [Plenodomus lingam JN3]CBX91611.1 predicted protein [Plenodomus lingam JN3]
MCRTTSQLREEPIAGLRAMAESLHANGEAYANVKRIRPNFISTLVWMERQA